MSYYALGEITLKNSAWVKEYLRSINAFIEKHEGRILSRTVKMEKLEGTRALPTNVILVEFPNRQSAFDFLNDPEYQPLRRSRLEGSSSEFLLFPGEDLATAES